MDDPLFKAADEAKEEHGERPHVLHEYTENAHLVGELVEKLREQAVDAMRGGFFDDGIEAEVQPLRSVMLAEAGTLILRASRRQPRYRMRLEFSVRTDREAENSGARYEVRGNGAIWCESVPGSRRSSFEILPTVREGSLELDGDQLRSEIASAIRAVGKTSG
jgi:hypothetical protein